MELSFRNDTIKMYRIVFEGFFFILDIAKIDNSF